MKAKYYVEAWTDLGDQEIFFSEEKAIRWLVKTTSHGASGWYLVHEHPYGEEDCACAQYLDDHRPQVVNGKIEHY